MINSKTVAVLAVLGVAAGATFLTPRSSQAEVAWPPRAGQPFPDVQLVDQTGKTVKISSFRGKVILVEYIGMNCPACQAFAGAHDRGSLGKVRPQQGLDSIEKLFPSYTRGLSLDDERIVFVQVLLYDLSLGAPTVDDAGKWAQHFQLERSKPVVLVPKKDLRGPGSYNLIPGFQLVDKNFVVRSDSTGHHPRHDLYTELLPAVRGLLEEPVVGAFDRADDSSSSSSVDRRDLLAIADEETIAAAYRAIPHRRTVFDQDAVGMSARDKTYLHDFFYIVDLAMVERVRMARWLASGGRQGKVASNYAVILEELRELDPPRSLRQVQKLVAGAIEEQRAFLDEWKRSGKREFPRGNPRVQGSSSKLRRAYSLLMKAFPREGRNNKQAFFDYLCALDFI